MNNRGDSNQITREYFDSILLEARYWDSDLPSTEMALYGETFATPIMSAALSHLDNVCPGGAVKMAREVKAAGSVHWTGMGEAEELEAILATGAKTVKIIKPHLDNEIIYEKIAHAEAHGAFAVGMDIDHCFDGKGNYDLVLGLPMHSKTLSDLKEYVRFSKRPFIVKGVLSAQDAEKCVEAGVQGIVVSHHHGIMPYAVPPLMILPEIIRVTEHRIPVFVDCGIESGIDVFKALALGADAVCVGRHLMQVLPKEDGAVTAAIQAMNGELMSIMARTGAKSLKEIDPSVLHFLK